MEAKAMVLFVGGRDDFQLVKDGLEAYESSYALECAKDASECLRYVGQKRPDLILLDVSLPGLDGFALRANLKTTDAKCVPVIYLTKGYDIEMTRKMGMLSADDFIGKPINMPELHLRIQKIMLMRCYRNRSARAPHSGGMRRTRLRRRQ